MATKKINLAALSFAFIFAACGDESATESTPLYTTVVGDAGELPDCLSKNEGEQAFVTNESAFRICANGKWYSASQNINGSFDFHCSTELLADSSGLKILCGGDSIGVLLNGTDGKNGSDNTVVKNGKDGIDGKDGKDGVDGKDGAGCTAVVLSDNSGMKILCGGDSVGVVLNGRDGERGTDGKNGTNGTDGQNGANGEGCTLKQIDVNNLRIKCGGDSAMIFVNEVFNPSSSSSQVIQSSSSHALENFVETRDNLALCDTSYKNTRIFVKQDSLYFGCDGVKWIPDSTRGYLVKSVSVLGAAQKGPFKFGTPLELRELRLYNDTLRYSGIKYVDEISSNKGNYVIPKVNLVYPYAEIAVRGLWRNEVSGAWSTDSMTLQALTDLSNRTDANVNLLTHLEYARAMKLVEKGYSVSAAKKQADYEIMTAFGFATTIKFSEDLSIFEDYDDNLWYDAANATLLAMSILFMENRNDAEILSAIETFRQDIAEDGEWNATDAEKTKAAMADWAESFDKTVVRANVKSWNVLEIPDYEEYLDVFWHNAYGLGGCANTRYDVVSPVTNKLSGNYNIHYICKSTGWQKATDFEKDTYQWSNGNDGEVKKGNVTEIYYEYKNGNWVVAKNETALGGICTNKREGEVGLVDTTYFICDNDIWRNATVLEYDTYLFGSGEDGEVRNGRVNDDEFYIYENGAWRPSANEIENNLGACVASRLKEVGKVGSTYYTCKSTGWTKSTALEYDTYGWAEGTEGDVKPGSVNPANHYVYENGVWRESANEIEYNLGGCVANRLNEVGKSDGIYYTCKSTGWTKSTALEYDTYGWAAGTEGDVKSGSVNSVNHYVYENGAWREPANEMEYEYGTCVVSRNNEKHIQNGAYYICTMQSWQSVTVEEYELGLCVAANNGLVKKFNDRYYICKLEKWTNATVLEYDTYGKICSKDGSVVSGEVIVENKYVCDAEKFRELSDMEVSLGKACASYTESSFIRKQITDEQDSFYLCKYGQWTSSIISTVGKIFDSRNGKYYRIADIGGQTWMMENLNFETENSFNFEDVYGSCYWLDMPLCETSGLLYTWAAAMDSAGNFSTNGKNCGYGKVCTPTYPVRGICPEGWHLPTETEWQTLYSAMGSSPYAMQAKGFKYWPDALDTYGFSAPPVGYHKPLHGVPYVGFWAEFWSATEDEYGDNYANYANSWHLTSGSAEIGTFSKDNGLSVRCVKD